MEKARDALKNVLDEELEKITEDNIKLVESKKKSKQVQKQKITDYNNVGIKENNFPSKIEDNNRNIFYQ